MNKKINFTLSFLFADIGLLSLLLISFDLFFGFSTFAPQSHNIIETFLAISIGFGTYLVINFFLVIICFIVLILFNRGGVRSGRDALLCFLLPAIILLGGSLNLLSISGLTLLIFLVFIFIGGWTTGHSDYFRWKWIEEFPKVCYIAMSPLAISPITLIIISSIKKFEVNSFPNIVLMIASVLWGILSLIVGLISFRNGGLGLHLPKRRKLLVITSCFILVPLIGFIWSVGEFSAVKSKKNQYNFLLVTFDTLRADAVSGYGSHIPTPAIDGVAKEGILFEQVYSQAPWTLPSMTSLFSSMYPTVLESGGGQYRIPEKVQTFAETLRNHGYITSALVGSYLLGSSSGILQGFNESLVLNHHLKVRNRFSQILPMMEEIIASYFPKPEYRYLMNSSEILTRRAIEFIRRHSHRNFFLWVHFVDPHDPYNPPGEFRKGIRENGPWPVFAPRDPGVGTPTLSEIREGLFYLDISTKDYIRDLYQGEVLYADHLLSIILNVLKEENIADRTMICLTSDHGEEFWEHGDYYHGQSLYEELLHVPLIFSIPGYKGGYRIVYPVSLIDVMPTLFDIAKLPIPPGYEGKSLLPILRDQTKFTNRMIFSEATSHYEPRKAIIEQGFKFILGMKSGKEELYALSIDPHEMKNLATSNPEQAKVMRKKLQDWMLQEKKLAQSISKNRKDMEVQEEQIRRMKAIGYIQ